MLKTCSKCKKEMDLNSSNFEPRSNTKDGFRNQCRACRNNQRKENYTYNEEFYWSEYENNILIEYYPIMSAKNIHEKFLNTRTIPQINDHATKKLNLTKTNDYSWSWSIQQFEYLKENYENLNLDLDEISRVINKEKSVVAAMASKLNLKRNVWSDEEIELVYKYYSDLKVDDLQEKYLHFKTREQIIRFANRKKLYKTYDFKKNVAINNLREINENQKMTRPEIITENILKSLNINYTYQYFNTFYWMDFFLPKNNLFIEVQGDYFHCNPNKNFNYNVLNKNKIITKDKRKHSYTKNKCGIEILYLWEDDLVNQPELCTQLIIEYINTNGNLKDYHSYNYSVKNNKLILSENICCIGY